MNGQQNLAIFKPVQVEIGLFAGRGLRPGVAWILILSAWARRGRSPHAVAENLRNGLQVDNSDLPISGARIPVGARALLAGATGGLSRHFGTTSEGYSNGLGKEAQQAMDAGPLNTRL